MHHRILRKNAAIPPRDYNRQSSAAEMLLFCGLHISTGDPSYGPMIYWLVVAAVCAFIIYGRLIRRPS